jgi:hypothetical protein
VVRAELDALKKLGDQVQVEDVIKGAGSMVGAGFSPQVLAQMLSQMPTTGGQALEAWVVQQDERATQMDQQLQQKVLASSVHRGISAMAALHVDHIKGEHQKAAAAVNQARPPMQQLGGALSPGASAQSAEAPGDEEGEQ